MTDLVLSSIRGISKPVIVKVCKGCGKEFSTPLARRENCDVCRKEVLRVAKERWDQEHPDGSRKANAASRAAKKAGLDHVPAKIKTCECGATFEAERNHRKLCDACRAKNRQATVAKWDSSEEGKAWKAEQAKKYGQLEYVKESNREKVKAWVKTEEGKSYRKAYEREYFKDPSHAIAKRLRLRLFDAVRKAGGVKKDRTFVLTGCSIYELMAHLEKGFVEGMTWENRGSWEIDHIVPCASFDLTDPEQQFKCFHYTNLQPLWRFDNRSKGGKLNV